MIYNENDTKTALDFADKVKLTAKLDPADEKMIVFEMSQPLPENINKDVKELLDIAIKYYQRSIFTGEYLREDDFPPNRESNDPIDEINFYLGYYQDKLIEELRKAFDPSTEKRGQVNKEGRKLTPYAEEMLALRKEMMARYKKK